MQDACFHLGPGEKAGSNLDKGKNVDGVAVDVWSLEGEDRMDRHK